MRLDLGFLCLVAMGGATSAWAAEDALSDEPIEMNRTRDRGVSLSVGTGPLPLNALSLGVTGLAGRVLFPSGKGSVFLSGGHTSFRGSDFPDQGFADRSFTRAGGTTAMVGFRGGSPPDKPKVVPYGIGGAMLIYGATGSGDTDRKSTSSLWSAGAQAGFGLDGFITPAVSAGVEVGGMGFFALGGSRWDGDSNGKFSGFALSSFAAAQLTVWR